MSKELSIFAIVAAVAIFTGILFAANIVFKDIPHTFYFNVLVDDQRTVTEFQCFCYKEYYDRIEFTGSSGSKVLKKKDGRVIEISEIRSGE